MNRLCRICWDVAKVVVAIVVVIVAFVALVIALELPDTRREETRRWLCETRLPEIMPYAPATLAEFVAFMEQASKDYDRPDKPKDKRGLRFYCGDKVGKIVFSPKPKDDLPIIETLSGTDMSFWDALTNACERTGCKFDICGGTLEIRG